MKTECVGLPSNGIRVAFAGCHEISWHCLRQVAELARRYGDTVAAAFNLPPEAGRKHAAFVEFDNLSAEYGFPLHKVSDLGSAENTELLRSLHLDALMIVGWHRIVPQEVIDTAPTCLGMHSSLLPKNRGSSPVNWAIIRGEERGGVTWFHLTAGVDSGDVIAQRGFEILPSDTCKDAYDHATVAAVELLKENWRAIHQKRVPRVPQDETQATYNDRRRPKDGKLDWSTSTVEELYNYVRALTHPYPGAFATFRGRKLLVWAATTEKEVSGAMPGTIVEVGERIRVAANGGYIGLKSLQFEGEPECGAAVFGSVYDVTAGEALS